MIKWKDLCEKMLGGSFELLVNKLKVESTWTLVVFVLWKKKIYFGSLKADC